MFEWLKKPEEPARPLLDTAYLERLREHLGDDAIRELVADGLIELIDRIHRLEALAADADIEGIARLSHDLTGMAGHLGLARLSQCAVDMNRATRDDPGGSPVALIAPFLESAPASLDSLSAYLRDHNEQDGS